MINSIFIDTWGWLTLNDAGERRHKEVANLYPTLIAERTPIYRTYLVSLLKRLTGKNYRHFGKFSLIHTEQRFWQRYQMDSIPAHSF